MEFEEIEALRAKLAEAERKNFELQAQLASRIASAFDNLPKAQKFKGSGVILQLTALGGEQIIQPVLIRDGLSNRTVSAIQEDLRLTFELATLVNPAMARVKIEGEK